MDLASFNITELLNKYGVYLNGLERVYWEPLFDRDYNLENTCPLYLLIDHEVEFRETAWSKLVISFASYLQKTYPKSHEELYNFRSEWTDKVMFSPEKDKVLSAEVEPGLFLDFDFTSLHSAWFIQDLLKLYEVDPSRCWLLIYRHPVAEPKEIKDTICNILRERFKFYLVNDLLKTEETANTVIKNMEFINKGFEKMHRTHFNFYLFSAKDTLANYRYKFIHDCQAKLGWTSKHKEIAQRCLDLYAKFFKKVVIFANENPFGNCPLDKHGNPISYKQNTSVSDTGD